MKPKKITSWGVSFASLALVAGMTGYLGFTHKDSLSKSNPSLASTQNSNQQTPSQNGNNSKSSIGSSTNDDGDSTDDNNQSSFHNGSSGQDNNQLSNGSFGQHRGLDTTTGGT
jgi:hypothetical protein